MNGINAFWKEQANELKSHTAYLGDQFISTASFDAIKEAAHDLFKKQDKSTQYAIIAEAQSISKA
jgi:hypothetical protein